MGLKTTEVIESLAQPIIEAKGLELVDVQYKKEGQNWFLRVYIDKDGGVDLEDCTVVSEALSDQLDKDDPIKEAYFLEVASPGAERPLHKEKDLQSAIGKNIHVTTYELIDGLKSFEGYLVHVENGVLAIDVKVKHTTKRIEIPYDKVANARLAIAF